MDGKRRKVTSEDFHQIADKILIERKKHDELLKLHRQEIEKKALVKEMQESIRSVETIRECPPGFEPDNDDGAYLESQKAYNCHEVFQGIVIGNGETAVQKDYLQFINVTHVLNAAQGSIMTNAAYYEEEGIQFLGYDMRDHESTDISQYFEEAANFIDAAVSQGGRVFVHCYQGISRSPALVIAYLVKKKNMPVLEAFKIVKQRRWIRPNDGFLLQLAELDIRRREQ